MTDSSNPTPPGPGLESKGLVLVFMAYLLLAVVLTWPLIVRLDHYVLSEHLDVATAFYNLWWFHQAVCELQVSPWHNPLINYPEGASMALFPMWVPYDLLALPLVSAKGADGLPVAFNLVSLFSFALCGLAGFVLVRYLTQNPAAAFVAGIALAFAPYRLWNLTRWHAICLELVAFAIYFFLRMVREGTRLPAIGFAAAVVCLVYTSPPYTGDLALMLLIIFGFLLVNERKSVLKRRTLLNLAAAGVVIVALSSPFLLAAARELMEPPTAIAQSEQDRETFSANLAGFVSPGRELRTYSLAGLQFPYSDPELKREHGVAGYEVFIGFTALALAVLGASRRKVRAGMWAALALFFVLLALGPVWHAGAHTFRVPSFYNLISPVLPWLRFERAPVRHLGMAWVSLAVLLGIGLAWLGGRFPSRARLLYGLAALMVIFEFNQAPLTLDRIPVPDFVYELKDDPSPGSVLNLPELPDIKRYSGFYHMHHGRPLIFHLASRGDVPVEERSAIHRYFHAPAVWFSLSSSEREEALSELLSEFAAREVRYVIVFRRFIWEEERPESWEGLREMLFALGPDRRLADDEVYLVLRFVR